jgi:sugar lactone lactonase YvrE
MLKLFLSAAIILLSVTCQFKEKKKVMNMNHVSIRPVWATDTIFKIPESVFYDKDRSVIYVANINGNAGDLDGNGFLSKISPTGKIIRLNWITGLNGPKGMDVFNNKLYVTDINRVAEIDLDRDSIASIIQVSGSKFLNDLTIDNEGVVYFSDTEANRIFQLKNREISIWLEGDILNHPNGLYFDGDIMWLASMGNEEFRSIDMVDKTITMITGEIGHCDGIAPDGLGNFLVSNWEGEIYFIDNDGQKIKILDSKKQKINSADIDYINNERLIIVPTFYDNRVMAYELNYND